MKLISRSYERIILCITSTTMSSLVVMVINKNNDVIAIWHPPLFSPGPQQFCLVVMSIVIKQVY